MPLIGLVADHYCPRGAFTVLPVLPLIAIPVSAVLRERP
jgi:hypothetical protein